MLVVAAEVVVGAAHLAVVGSANEGLDFDSVLSEKKLIFFQNFNLIFLKFCFVRKVILMAPTKGILIKSRQ